MLKQQEMDGLFLFQKVPFFDCMNETQIYALTQSEFNCHVRQLQEKIAKQCTVQQMLPNDTMEKNCLGTTVHSVTPRYGFRDNFFFDGKFMKINRKSPPTKRTYCDGSYYFNKQLRFVQQRYIVYDGGIEGIRNGCSD